MTAPARYEGLDKVFIGGVWRDGRSDKTFEDKDPYTGEVLLRIKGASEDDLDEAYESAREAQKGWIAMLPSERGAIVRKAAEIMMARKEEIAEWICREGGGVRIKGEMETQFAHDVTLEASSFPSRVEGKILPCDIPGKENRVYRKPVGVVGVISPWNFPLQLSSRSVAPALAVGNAVVLKPASDTAVTGGTILGKIYEEAGLPPGVLNVVPGSGSDIGDAFVSHPIPRVISFTGSTPVGRHIGELAVKASIIKKVALELGGNGPLVILDDADLDLAVDVAVNGKFLNAGQICMIINRIVVDAKVYDEFVARFLERVRGLKYGDPKDPDTIVGPVINQKQLDSLMELIQQGKEDGATLAVGGEAEGLVLQPTVFTDVRNDMRVARHELFGPVATVIKVADEAEALRVANDTDYGLSSAVVSRDLDRATLFAMKIEAGMTHINDIPVADLPNSPFGGEKNSGIGRFGGEWAIEEFTTDHWITVQRGRREYPF